MAKKWTGVLGVPRHGSHGHRPETDVHERLDDRRQRDGEGELAVVEAGSHRPAIIVRATSMTALPAVTAA